MTDDELIARLRGACYLAFDDGTNDYGTAPDAADRIEQLAATNEALVKERDALVEWNEQASVRAEQASVRAEQAEDRADAERGAAYAKGFSDAEAAIGQQNAAIHDQLARAKARAERLEAALREIAAEASVPVRTKKKGGIKHKWMYRGWRKIAVERIDIARAALKGADHE